jgi:hypothetical protein
MKVRPPSQHERSSSSVETTPFVVLTPRVVLFRFFQNCESLSFAWTRWKSSLGLTLTCTFILLWCEMTPTSKEGHTSNLGQKQTTSNNNHLLHVVCGSERERERRECWLSCITFCDWHYWFPSRSKLQWILKKKFRTNNSRQNWVKWQKIEPLFKWGRRSSARLLEIAGNMQRNWSIVRDLSLAQCVSLKVIKRKSKVIPTNEIVILRDKCRCVV